MSRAAARPLTRLLAAFLHATCVLAVPGLHLWQVCGCGHAHAARPVRRHAACEHHLCCRHERPATAADSKDSSGGPSRAPAHDPDDCPVCQKLALARIAAPTVRLTAVTADSPLVARAVPPLRPLLAAAAVACRGPPALAA